MTEWQSIETKPAPKDRPFAVRCGDEETVAQWNNDRKMFELKTPFSGKVSGSMPMWKELPELPK
jgi:hypothetical protein